LSWDFSERPVRASTIRPSCQRTLSQKESLGNDFLPVRSGNHPANGKSRRWDTANSMVAIGPTCAAARSVSGSVATAQAAWAKWTAQATVATAVPGWQIAATAVQAGEAYPQNVDGGGALAPP
jgi:hypothetical protein